MRRFIASLAMAVACFALAMAAPATAQEVEDDDSKKLFIEKCSNCHGETGMGDTAAGRAMKVPTLQAPPSAEEFVPMFRDNPKHASIAKKLTDEEIETIYRYVQQLPERAGTSQ